MRYLGGPKIIVRDGWDCTGKTGVLIGTPVVVEVTWAPVVWDGDEDPSWYKMQGLYVQAEGNWVPLDSPKALRNSPFSPPAWIDSPTCVS